MHKFFIFFRKKWKRFFYLSELFSRSDIHFLIKCEVLLISHDKNKPYSLYGLAYSPLVDSIKEYIERLGFSALCISKPISKLRIGDTFSRSLNLNSTFLWHKIIEKIFGRSINFGEQKFWENIILRTRPNCVIAIQPSPALCAAGKSLSVGVFDLQHGIIEPSVYYNSQLVNEFGVSGFPDAVLVWDYPSEKAVASCLPYARAVCLGNPWLERFINPVVSDRLVKDEAARVEEICTVGKPKILVSVQRGVDSGPGIDIPPFVSKGLRQLLDKGWVIWVRFHPVQMSIFGIEALKMNWIRTTGLDFDGLEVVDASLFALPALLRRAAAHITSHSAVAIDSHHMGVSSLLWRNDDSVREWFKHYIDDGSVRLLADATSNGISEWAEDFALQRGDLREQKGASMLRHSLLEELCQYKNIGV